jgi:hypothetical protein
VLQDVSRASVREKKRRILPNRNQNAGNKERRLYWAESYTAEGPHGWSARQGELTNINAHTRRHISCR